MTFIPPQSPATGELAAEVNVIGSFSVPSATILPPGFIIMSIFPAIPSEGSRSLVVLNFIMEKSC